jgi:hypothetical protein
VDAAPVRGDAARRVVRVGVGEDPADLVERDLEFAQDPDVARDLDLVAVVEALAVAA